MIFVNTCTPYPGYSREEVTLILTNEVETVVKEFIITELDIATWLTTHLANTRPDTILKIKAAIVTRLIAE